MSSTVVLLWLIVLVACAGGCWLWEARGRVIVPPGGGPRVMGVVNVTPDSFSESGRPIDHAAAIARGLELARAGAHLLDVGGESSRPGSKPISAQEELRRVVPVIEALAARAGVPLSVDTTKAEVARAALQAGASIVNDITALRADPHMAALVAESGAGVILMHMQGTPATMQRNPRYDDVVAEVRAFLAARVEWAMAQGIGRAQIAIDPGIGFGKSFEHNLALLRNLERFANLNCALVVGSSRKAFLGTITGRDVTERATASVAASLLAITRGARVVRVHDVAPMMDAIKIWDALHGWDPAP